MTGSVLTLFAVSMYPRRAWERDVPLAVMIFGFVVWAVLAYRYFRRWKAQYAGRCGGSTCPV
ncbi:hypothetical protein [Saccharopolyspora spinosa]|uniref:hypothetical protein n=1 Tax=Saccharopolyspora spinosa TaxID=60894 RepID=UPI000237A7DA|nr:hypothetical protein [Saccharopolyspora spinosa]